MAETSLLAYAPLGTAIVWLGLAAYLVLRERCRTWTELSFVATCLFVGVYALADVFFFTAPTKEAAYAAEVLPLSSLTLVALFFMFYGVMLHARVRRSLFLAVLPTAAFLALIPRTVLVDVHAFPEAGVPYVADHDPPWFAAWAAYLFALVAIGLVSIYRTYREVLPHAPKLARHISKAFVAFAVAVALGGSTNLVTGYFHIHVAPLFSTVLVAPGLLLARIMTPMSERGISEALRRRKAGEYKIQGLALTYEDGTLLGSMMAPGTAHVDEDLFSATLEVIQNFMRTSFPALRGKWLRSIHHGDLTLVMERGRYTTLTVVLQGKENDQLRRLMRDSLAGFEERNREVLENWRGIASEASGTGVLFLTILGAG